MKEYKIDNHEPSYLPDGEWKLVWADEFDGTELDRSKWDFRLNFWGKRFDAYTDKGVTLDGNSHAVFTPVKMEDGRICSAQLQTGSNSFDMLELVVDDNSSCRRKYWPLGKLPKPTFMHRYGYYECRCKLQKTDGWWSAFWLQSSAPGTTYDPKWSGVEVDIMEYFAGYFGNKQLTSGNIYGGYGDELTKAGRIFYDFNGDEEHNPEEFKKGLEEFHRFGVLWTENEYVFYIDGKELERVNDPISHVPQFILLTTEVQGYRRGDGTKHDEKAEASLDDKFIVDYVRVFDIKK